MLRKQVGKEDITHDYERSDMLTRIRNANTAKHDTVDVPASKMKIAIANILLDEGYIAKYDLVEDGHFQTIHITLKYGVDKNEKVISGLKRISKPGLRVYASTENIPRVLGYPESSRRTRNSDPFYKQRCSNRQRSKKTRRRRRGSLLRMVGIEHLMSAS